MRLILSGACVVALACGLSAGPFAQGGAPAQGGAQGAAGAGPARGRQAAGGPDAARVIPGGGIFVTGWQGKIDSAEANNNQVLNNSKLSMEGAAMHVETGPATTYWNPANRATGNYTVKATFTEAEVHERQQPSASLRDRDRAATTSARRSRATCTAPAYGNGTFIVRAFGPSEDPKADVIYNVNGRGASPNDAIHKAAGPGQPVTQDVAVTVKADTVECAVNGAVVGTYPEG